MVFIPRCQPPLISYCCSLEGMFVQVVFQIAILFLILIFAISKNNKILQNVALN